MLDTRKMRTCSYLLPDPGGEVVRECLDEIDHQRSQPLTFAAFREANLSRHPAGIESWSASNWIAAIVGELGELASLIKMRDGLPGNKFSPTDEQIAKEAADVFTYLDLFCAANGIDLGRVVAERLPTAPLKKSGWRS